MIKNLQLIYVSDKRPMFFYKMFFDSDPIFSGSFYAAFSDDSEVLYSIRLLNDGKVSLKV